MPCIVKGCKARHIQSEGYFGFCFPIFASRSAVVRRSKRGTRNIWNPYKSERNLQKLTRHPVTYIDMTPGYVDTTEFWKGQKRAPGYEMQIEPWRRRATHLSSICVASSILSWTNSIYFLETPNLRRDIHWCPGGFVSVWNRSPFLGFIFRWNRCFCIHNTTCGVF